MDSDIQITYSVEVVLTREEVTTILSNEEDVIRYVDMHINTSSEEDLDTENVEIINREDGTKIVNMDYFTFLCLEETPEVSDLLNHVSNLIPEPFIWYTGIGIATIIPSHITYYTEGEGEVIPFNNNNE